MTMTVVGFIAKVQEQLPNTMSMEEITTARKMFGNGSSIDEVVEYLKYQRQHRPRYRV